MSMPNRCTNCGLYYDAWEGHDCDPNFAYILDDPDAKEKTLPHYLGKEIQPLEYILANQMDYCEGNIVKYVTRYKEKGGIEDLRKARVYLDALIEYYEKKNVEIEHKS